MATRMLQRRGTAAEWASANPVLASGEIGYETDTKVIKIGDGVTTWTALATPYIPKSLVDALGDLIVGTADNTVARLPRGTVGQRLTVAADGSLVWATPPNTIDPAIVDAKGDLIVGTADNTVARLPRGTTGQRLQVAADGSLVWVTPQNAIDPAIVDAIGDLIVGTAADTVGRLAHGSTGQVLTAMADGSLAWATPAATGIPPTTFDAKGDLLVGTGNDTYARVFTGANGQMLVSDSSQPAGVAWGYVLTQIAAGFPGLVVQGFGSGAGDLQEWKDQNGGSILSKVDILGKMYAPDFVLGGASIGGAWTSYTPTVTNATTPTVFGRYKLVGKTLHLHIGFTGGTVTATGVLTVTLPAGLTAATGFSNQIFAGNATPGNWFVGSGGSVITSIGSPAASAGLNGIAFNGTIEVN